MSRPFEGSSLSAWKGVRPSLNLRQATLRSACDGKPVDNKLSIASPLTKPRQLKGNARELCRSGRFNGRVACLVIGVDQ